MAVRRNSGRLFVVLDRTAFYPEGGGQPADQGVLEHAGVSLRVVDVQESERIEHVVDPVEPKGVDVPTLAPGTRVSGTIDGARRFDHMQQHTGQHLLSRAFLRRSNVETVSFHMGHETCTIDVAVSSLSTGTVSAVLDEAAAVIRENRPVRARVLATEAETETEIVEGMRKQSVREVHEGAFRVLTIEDYDSCACGGTHVSRTGEIESVMVLRTERVKGDLTRVHFVCGGRSRRDHAEKIRTVREVVRILKVDEAEVTGAAERLLGRVRAAEKQGRELRAELLPQRATALLEGAVDLGSVSVVATSWRVWADTLHRPRRWWRRSRPNRGGASSRAAWATRSSWTQGKWCATCSPGSVALAVDRPALRRVDSHPRRTLRPWPPRRWNGFARTCREPESSG